MKGKILKRGNERKRVRNELDRIGGKYNFWKRIQKKLKKERKVEKV